jgi:hypothetical protein
MLSDVLTVLSANQALDDTYVFFMSDNGLMLGEHRLVTTKDVAYEEAIRVPLMVMGPGIAAATQPFILFADDDVDLEPGCLKILWDALQADPQLGACGAESVADWRKDAASESISYTGRLSAGCARPNTLHRDRIRQLELYDMTNDPTRCRACTTAPTPRCWPRCPRASPRSGLPKSNGRVG